MWQRLRCCFCRRCSKAAASADRLMDRRRPIPTPSSSDRRIQLTPSSIERTGPVEEEKISSGHEKPPLDDDPPVAEEAPLQERPLDDDRSGSGHDRDRAAVEG